MSTFQGGDLREGVRGETREAECRGDLAAVGDRCQGAWEGEGEGVEVDVFKFSGRVELVDAFAILDFGEALDEDGVYDMTETPVGAEEGFEVAWVWNVGGDLEDELGGDGGEGHDGW